MAAEKSTRGAVPGFDLPADQTAAQIDARARTLLAQLTLAEKLGMMDGDPSFWPGLADMMNGGYADHPWHAGVVERLGIPGIRFADGPRGIVMDGATTFPVSMARGATFDIDLEERVGDIIGKELRALGGTLFGGVCINLPRHPAWGRAQESYGEDPFHLGEMGAAVTRGVQRHAMACVKHFALNSMENARFTVDVSISPRAFHEVYLPHFKRVVDEGVASVMSAYNSVNGEWCGQNAELLTGILKQKWGFEGFVLTDFIFGMRDAKKAALAGQDLEMPFRMHFHGALARLVESGEVPLTRIDDAVLRILRQQLRLIRPGDYSLDLVGCDAHRAVAREVAAKSIVLLQNEGDLLPLRGVQRLAVIGNLGNTPNTGDGGSSNTRPLHVVTPLEGLREALGSSAEVVYDDGSDLDRAREVARGADVALVVVGYTHADEGEFIGPEMMAEFAPIFPKPSPEEAPIAQGFAAATQQVGTFPPGGDRDSLRLRPHDEALILALSASNKRTVVAVMAGSTVIMESWRAQVPALLMLWYPGMEGGRALADILLGKVNPSGRLPLVVPKRAEDLPHFDKKARSIEYDLWHGYRKLDRDGVVPAFSFGFGLSYTTYRYARLVFEKDRLTASETLQATVDVTNTGALAGEDVVQLYFGVTDSAVERAPRQLAAFARVALRPGETKTVQLNVPVSRLGYYDEGQGTFVVEPATYEIAVGAHSQDAQALRGCVTVE